MARKLTTTVKPADTTKTVPPVVIEAPKSNALTLDECVREAETGFAREMEGERIVGSGQAIVAHAILRACYAGLLAKDKLAVCEARTLDAEYRKKYLGSGDGVAREDKSRCLIAFIGDAPSLKTRNMETVKADGDYGARRTRFDRGFQLASLMHPFAGNMDKLATLWDESLRTFRIPLRPFIEYWLAQDGVDPMGTIIKSVSHYDKVVTGPFHDTASLKDAEGNVISNVDNIGNDKNGPFYVTIGDEWTYQLELRGTDGKTDLKRPEKINFAHCDKIAMGKRKSDPAPQQSADMNANGATPSADTNAAPQAEGTSSITGSDTTSSAAANGAGDQNLGAAIDTMLKAFAPLMDVPAPKTLAEAKGKYVILTDPERLKGLASLIAVLHHIERLSKEAIAKQAVAA